PGTTRTEPTDHRSPTILHAALQCFSLDGFVDTTMEAIRERAAASTGSIYHHFKSKDHLAAVLYLEGIQQAQQAALTALERQKQAEVGIRALVSAYLEWAEQNPDYAVFLLTCRYAEFMSLVEAAPPAHNARSTARRARWAEPHVAAGLLPPFDDRVYFPILFGPCELLARNWLMSGRTPRAMDRARRVLAKAAFPALQ